MCTSSARSIPWLCCGASGLPPGQAVSIYVIQSVGMGLIGAGFGALIGVGVQRLVPHRSGRFSAGRHRVWHILAGHRHRISDRDGRHGRSLPCSHCWKCDVSLPLLAIRRRFESADASGPADPLRWAVYAVGWPGGILLTSILLTDRLDIGLGFFWRG